MLALSGIQLTQSDSIILMKMRFSFDGAIVHFMVVPNFYVGLGMTDKICQISSRGLRTVCTLMFT